MRHAQLAKFIIKCWRDNLTRHMSRPNVLLFVADDMGIGDVSASGRETSLVATPNIDLLAADGVRFLHMHSPSPVCAPTRYSILTGNLPVRSASSGFSLTAELSVGSGQRTLGHLFGDAGYATGLVGKLHTGGGLYTAGGNQVEWSDPAATIDWSRGIRQRSQLGYTSVFECHDGIQAPPYIYWQDGWPVVVAFNQTTRSWTWTVTQEEPRCRCDYSSDAAWMDSDPDGDGANGVFRGCPGKYCYAYAGYDTTRTGEIFAQAALNFLDTHAREPWLLHFNSQGVHIPHSPGTTFFDTPVRGRYDMGHLDMIHEVDLQLGLLVGRVEAHNLTQQTLVIFTSDNGGLEDSFRQFGHEASGGLRGYKKSDFEGGHRVPFHVRWPGLAPQGSTCEAPAVLTDLYATFTEMLGRGGYEGSGQAMDSTSIYRQIVAPEEACSGGVGLSRGVVLVQTVPLSFGPLRGDDDTVSRRDGVVAIDTATDHGVGLKVRAYARDSGLPAIEPLFWWADLATDPCEDDIVWGATEETAPAAVVAVFQSLARLMGLVASGQRTTPPLSLASPPPWPTAPPTPPMLPPLPPTLPRSPLPPNCPPPPPMPSLPPAPPPLIPCGWRNADGVSVSIRDLSPPLWCFAFDNDPAGCSAAYVVVEPGLSSPCIYFSATGVCTSGPAIICASPPPPFPPPAPPPLEPPPPPPTPPSPPRPSPPPTPTPPPCSPCTDEPNSYISSNLGGSCGAFSNWQDNCNAKKAWIEAQYCQYSCYVNGWGYDGNVCCIEPPSSPPSPSGPPPPPPSSPAQPQQQSQADCTVDEETTISDQALWCERCAWCSGYCPGCDE